LGGGRAGRGNVRRTSRLAGAGPFPNIDESQARDFRVDRNLDAQARPRVLSLRQANVENLAVANVDLRACRFFGAHGLDQLRVEPDCDFAEPPPRRWYTRRRTLAEEHHWHARSSLEDAAARADTKAGLTSNPHGPHDPGCWHPPKCQPAAWLEQEAKAEILDPPRIASLYRLLRKALEDRKDEPGAADFYYGEMEMRRRRPPGRRPEGRATQDRGERVILTFYWLVSGYGLRATRAFAALLVTLVLSTALLYLFGLQADHRDLSVALLQSIEGAAFRAADRVGPRPGRSISAGRPTHPRAALSGIGAPVPARPREALSVGLARNDLPAMGGSVGDRGAEVARLGGRWRRLWDEVLPVEARELPEDLQRINALLSDPA